MTSRLSASPDQHSGRLPSLYLALVSSLGLPVIIFSLIEVIKQPNPSWLYLLPLTVLASLMGIRMPLSSNRTGAVSFSVGDCFIFVAILLFGPATAALVAALEGVVMSLRFGTRHWSRFLFNVSQISISAFLAGFLFSQLYGPSTALDLSSLLKVTPALLLAVVLYWTLNSAAIAVAMGSAYGRSAREIWRECCAWFSPATLLGLGAALVVALSGSGIGLALLLALMIVALSLYYTHEIGIIEATWSKGARACISLLTIAGIVVTGMSLVQVLQQSDHNWAILAALTAIASLLTVYTPGSQKEDKGIVMTFSTVFVFMSILFFQPAFTAVISVVESSTSTLKSWDSIRGRRKILFNIFLLPLSAWLTAMAFHSIYPGALSLDWRVLLAFSIAGLFYYVVNAGAVSTVINLVTGSTKKTPWVASTNLAEAFLAFAVVLAVRHPSTLSLAVVAIGLLLFYQAHHWTLLQLKRNRG